MSQDDDQAAGDGGRQANTTLKSAFGLLGDRQRAADEAREREQAAAWKIYAGLLARDDAPEAADVARVATAIETLGLDDDQVQRHQAIVARYRESQLVAQRKSELIEAAESASAEFKRLHAELPRQLEAAEFKADRARRSAGEASRAANTLRDMRRDFPELVDGGLFALLDQQHAAQST